MSVEAGDAPERLARELNLPARGVRAAVDLFAAGHTVPFVARYRKEATGGLDEVQLRAVQEGRAAQVALDERRATILAAVEEQGALTPALRAKLEGCATRAELEDLYLPFKKKRKTRASQARERGLEPLAKRIREQPERGEPLREAAAFATHAEVTTAADALAGARDIVAEEVAEDAAVRAIAREALAREGLLVSTKARRKKAEAGAPPAPANEQGKFDAYLDYREPLAKAPSHRVLAVLRGEQEGVLSVKLALDDERLVGRLLPRVGHRPRSPFAGELAAAVRDSWDRLLGPSVETDVRAELKERADRDAVAVFGKNLGPKLLAPPLGPRPVIGVDPGLRTGCKCAAVDAAGALRGQLTIYPARGAREAEQAAKELVAFVKQHLGPALTGAEKPPADRAPAAAVAVGNGTAGRETEAFVREALAKAGLQAIPVVAVDEGGASVYSASDLARAELPDVDVTVRGAVSIARRLQDPLAELVKIDPRSIGVELDTASAPLLAHVAGIGPRLAQKIVAHREKKGAFGSRAALADVPGIGPKTYEQCAGFLRVRASKHPLDRSAVHPERYALVERMAKELGVPLERLVGDAEQAKRIPLERYVSADVGEPTLRDIVAELAAPGRDPRERFEPPSFRDDVRELKDLVPGMQLEGVVTNVVAFGCFVDVGVHHDGLVHVSELADRFVESPHDVVHVGQRLKVRVVSVDLQRQRIALSARSPRPEQRPGPGPGPARGQPGDRGGHRR